VPALKIAAKGDMRSLVQDDGLVYMRKRPVVVAFVEQVLDSARRVIGVAAHATETGVKHTDVKAAVRERRISGDKVLRDVTLREALAMHGDGMVLQKECLRATCRKHA